MVKNSRKRSPIRSKTVKPPKELSTVLDFVRYAVSRFNESKIFFGHGTTDPIAEAAFIVCEVLNLPPNGLETFGLVRLTGAEQKKIATLIDARIQTRKPAAYLLQKAYLRDVPFYVDERVIVPRSYLAELIESDLFSGEDFSLIEERGAVRRILDLCTGSGCLAVLAALQFPNAKVDAVDISPDALSVAEKNINEHALADRITLKRGDLFEPVAGQRYDLIISNPPYVDASGMAALPSECHHEPRLALDGGADGITIVGRIIDEVDRHLTASGGLLCEVGRGKPILELQYPTLPFLWLDSAESIEEVFWLKAEQLA